MLWPIAHPLRFAQDDIPFLSPLRRGEKGERSLLTVVGALALILLVACQPVVAAPGSAAGAKDLQPLVLWHALPPDATETLLAQVEEFNASNPWGITLAVERLATPSALRAQLKAAATRGHLPDLALVEPADLAELLSTGGLVDLQPYANSPDDGLDAADRQDLLPLFFDGSTVQPGQGPTAAWTSAPAYLHLFVLYYNADWLARLGAAAPPSDWEGFKQLCQAAITGVGTSERFGYVYANDSVPLLSWIWGRGGDVLSADNRHTTFNGPAGVASLALLHDLVDSGCAYVGDTASARDDFAHGQALFSFDSTAELGTYRRAIEAAGIFKNWGIAAPPHTTDRPIVVASGPRWTIWRTTPQRQQAAWRVVRWFSNPLQTAGWAFRLRAFPVRASAVRALIMSALDDPAYRAGLELLTAARNEPYPPGWDDLRRLMAQATAQAAHGVSPQRALDDAAAEADRILSAYPPGDR